MDQQPELLIFEVDGRRYGLPAAEVRELVRAVSATSLPQAPAIVEGVLNLRGLVVPVLDLRIGLGLSPKPAEPPDHLIVARLWGRLVALRVDRALELRRPVVASARSDGASSDGEMASVAQFDDGLVPILDLRAFLTRAESDALGAVLPATPTEIGQEAAP